MTPLTPGEVVVVTRGSAAHAPGTPGSLRIVVGVYFRSFGDHQHFVRLLEDDPLATNGYCTRRGDKGTWGSVVPRPDIKLDRRFCLRCYGDGFIMIDLRNGGDIDCAECPVCKGARYEP